MPLLGPGNLYRQQREYVFPKQTHPYRLLIYFPCPRSPRAGPQATRDHAQSPNPSKIIQTSPATIARVLTPPHPLLPKKTPIRAPGHAIPSRFFPLLTNSGPSPRGPAWQGMPSGNTRNKFFFQWHRPLCVVTQSPLQIIIPWIQMRHSVTPPRNPENKSILKPAVKVNSKEVLEPEKTPGKEQKTSPKSTV